MGYTLLTLVGTYPAWQNLAGAAPGDIGDPLLNTWILAWDVHALLTHPWRLFDANIFYPLPNTLAYSEHLLSTAGLVLPLALLGGEPAVAYNLSLLLSFPLAGLGMYLLVLRWTRRRGAAWLAGLSFAFAPYRMASVAHLQLLTIQWLPFSLLALDVVLAGEMAAGGRRRAAITWYALLVGFTSLQVLASWYLAVFSGLALGIYALAWLINGWRKGTLRGTLPTLGGLAISGLVVVGLALPLALPYLEVLPGLQAARPAWLAASFAARPTDFLAAAPHLRLAGPLSQGLAGRAGFTEENTLFLGVVGPLLALVGLVTALAGPASRMRWRAAALLAILVVSLGLTLAGPYALLTRLVPALTVVRVPPRWVIPATLALAALAGFGAAWLCAGRSGKVGGARGRNARRVGSAACYLGLSVLLLAESFAAPLPLAEVRTTAELPAVYAVLREEAGQGAPDWGVVELPMHVAPAPEFPETRRMLASSEGWWGLVNGYSGFTPPRQAGLDQGLADFPGQGALATLRELGAQGVRYLVVHPGEAPLERTGWEATDRWEAERGTSLIPMGRVGPDELYRINPYGDRLITQPEAARDAYWSAHAPLPVRVRFSVPGAETDIWLLAYGYQPGGDGLETRLTLYWQASARLDTGYTVFVHVLDAQGAILAQADGPPLADHYPTTAWQPHEIVQDSRVVLPGPRYLVGLYDPLSGERLPAYLDGTRLPDDAVLLAAD